MTVAFDAISDPATFTTTTPATFTHTPSGTPRAVVVTIVASGTSLDFVTGTVSYGGVAMTRIDTAVDTTTELGRSYIYFLGSGIPTGPQTVSITTNGGTHVKKATCLTLTAAGDTEVVTSGILQDNQANPQLALDTSSASSLRVAVLFSGLGAVTDITSVANTTEYGEFDFGAQVCGSCYQNTASTGSFTIGWTAATDDVAFVAAAVQEVAGGGATVTPAAVAVTTSFPTQAVLAASLVAPAVVAPTTTLPTAVTSIPVTVTPAPLTLLGAVGYLSVSTPNGGHVTTPDHASLDITGDIEYRADIAADDYTPPETRKILSKLDATTGYEFTIVITSGALRISHRDSAGNQANFTSSVAPTINDGERIQVRATLDVNNGSNQYEATFYTRSAFLDLTDNTGWTQLGSVQTAFGLNNIGAGGNALVLGADSDTVGNWLAGKFYQVLVYDGIGGTIVADPDFRDADQVTTPNTVFTDSQGRAWTITSPASWVANLPGVVIPPPTINVATGATTVTPAAIAPAVALPTPTAQGQARTTPAAITPTVSLPLPTAQGQARTSPAAIAPSVSLPTPTAIVVVFAFQIPNAVTSNDGWDTGPVSGQNIATWVASDDDDYITVTV